MNKVVIAIDGPAASGKGTLARKLAEKLNYAHLDTGAIYRMVALQLVQQNIDYSEFAAVEAARFVQQNMTENLMLHPDLRLDEVGTMASKVSAVPEVRSILLDAQRHFAQNPPDNYDGSVLDGRDIGTIVCPEANMKLYVTASVAIRAQRRLKELQNKGISATYDAVLKDMEERDLRDMSRDIAPLKPASDAVILDTSDLTADQALKQALEIAVRTLG
ncbi:MAG: (d)CMP kinase [Micavibrio aeruginosavorus]|uniref:Cytidylate kinase n=1 Tax=Micavibrio aeruginosavorus TaxID=349221 RepID=A0A2W5FK64_9BACT|nr:MAG: (d)CMP kinase [Micavibrio aeruginosavorus]